MFILTKRASVKCDHLGVVNLKAGQDWVTIEGVPIMVDSDLEGRSISRCPWTGGGMKPCTRTLRILTGKSSLIRIDGKRVYLDNFQGLTDGAPPPGTFRYKLNRAWQNFVKEGE